MLGKAGERGDLLVTLDVQVPTELTPEERLHYEALAALRAQPV
jgi:DnaJ-class molecular chaperone